MSQVQSFVGSMGPAGPILTLTGDVGGPVAPDGLGNIDIVGEVTAGQGFASIEGDPGTNTLNVVARHDEVTTNNAAVTSFVNTTVAVPLNTAIVMTANVIGNRDDYSAACGGLATGVVRRAGGAAVFVGGNVLQSEDAAAGVPQFGIQANGNNIEVYAQGLVGQTWNWTCTFQYQVQLL